MKRFLSILCASALALLCLPGAVLAQNEARWDFDESAEGWNVNKANNGVSIEAKSGKLIYTLAKEGTTNTFLLSPDNLGIDGSELYKIKINVKNDGAAVANIMAAFITEEDQSWDTTWTSGTTKTVMGPSVNAQSDYTEYVVDMSVNELWKSGTIKRLRIMLGDYKGEARRRMFIDSICVEGNRVEAKQEAKTGDFVNQYVSEKAYEEAAAVLLGAGLLPEAAFETDRILTRGEFAYIIARSVYNTVPEETTENSAYSDVPGIYGYADSIRVVSEANVMNGVSENRFDPHCPVKYNEVCAALVNLTGYGLRAHQRGGYPRGYIAVANENKITKGVLRSDGITYAQAVVMLKNALECNAVETVPEQGTMVNRVADKKLISVIADVYDGRGVVVSDRVTSLDSASGTDKNSIIVQTDDGILELYTEETDMLGRSVEFYYQLDSSDDAVLLYIKAADKNRELVISYDDIDAETTNRKIVFSKDGTGKRTVNIDTDAATIYNGRYFDFETDETYKPLYGSLRLTDNNGDGKYDVVFVENLVCHRFEAESGEILYFDTGAVRLDPDDYDYIEIFRDGKISESLKPGDIVLFAESSDKEVLKLYASGKGFEGVTEAAQEDKVTIGGKEYTLNPYFTSKLSLGVRYLFNTDSLGNIAAIDTDFTADNSYLFMISVSSENTVGSPLKLRALTPSGKVQDFECAQKIKIDEKRYNTNSERDAIRSHLCSAGDELNLKMGRYSQPIKIKTDAEGKITSIDTLMFFSDGDTLIRDTVDRDNREIYAGGKLSDVHYYKNGVFSGKLIIDSDTVIFDLPSDYRSLNKYYSYNMSELMEGKYNIIPFNANGCLYSDLLLILDSGDSVEYGDIGVVNKVKEAYNKAEETDSRELEVYIGGKALKIMAADASVAEGIERGDVIRCGMGKRGNCTVIKKLLDYSESKGVYSSKLITSTGSGTYTSEKRFVYGTVADRENSIIVVSYGDSKEVFKADSCSVSVYDTYTKTARSGSIGDIVSAEQIGIGTDVVIQTRYGIVKHIIVYK